MGINRRRRAEFARAAQEIRQRGQRKDWPVPRIAAQIRRELPEVHPLEAWRWAYGWSRAQAVQQVAEYYQLQRYGKVGMNTSMLCRYEHGEIRPGPEYAEALCQVYRAGPVQLGLQSSYPPWAVPLATEEYGAAWEMPTTPRNGYSMTADGHTALAALRESIALAREVEGPAGGPDTLTSLQAAVRYYDLNYSTWAPAVLAGEVHQTRQMIVEMLHQQQTDSARTELRRHAGWLSALVGNLAFHLADYPAAAMHLSTAERLGAAVGDTWLRCWTLGARAMIAHSAGQYEIAADFGERAHELADSPLRRAQMLAWAWLRPTAARGGHAHHAAQIAASAQDALAGAAERDQPGRFGFDLAELELHLAEASLLTGDHAQARRHAQDSIEHIPHGRAGWAAAQLCLARGEAARGRTDDATALADDVLDTIPAGALRAGSRDRLTALNTDLAGISSASTRDFRDRIAALAPLVPAGRASDEPNGM